MLFNIGKTCLRWHCFCYIFVINIITRSSLILIKSRSVRNHKCVFSYIFSLLFRRLRTCRRKRKALFANWIVKSTRRRVYLISIKLNVLQYYYGKVYIIASYTMQRTFRWADIKCVTVKWVILACVITRY